MTHPPVYDDDLLALGGADLDGDDGLDALALDGDPLEESRVENELPRAQLIRREIKARATKLRQERTLAETVPRGPEPGEAIHVLVDARWDAFVWIPVAIRQWLGGKAVELWLSTFTMNRATVVILSDLLDAGKIGQVHAVTSLAFKAMNPAPWALLTAALDRHKGRHRSVRNHSKIMLLHNNKDYLVITTSANLATNYNAEFLIVSNDQELYIFYAGWLDQILRQGDNVSRKLTVQEKRRRRKASRKG